MQSYELDLNTNLVWPVILFDYFLKAKGKDIFSTIGWRNRYVV